MERFDRNVRFFGKEGQDRLRRASVVVIGAGGLGTHVVQQLAYLGVGQIAVVDHEDLATSNKNRYVSAYAGDPAQGSRKVDLCRRMVRLIDPGIEVLPVFAQLRSHEAFDAIKSAAYTFGCLDNDGARVVLTELCSAYKRPYFDLATEIVPGAQPLYGGRVFASWAGRGCPVCYGLLDLVEARQDLESPAARADRANLYGLQEGDLANVGPSVVSINGVVASLAVTEFAVAVTRLREPHRLLTYRGDLGRVTLSRDEPAADCYYCREVYGLGDRAEVERYILSLASEIH